MGRGRIGSGLGAIAVCLAVAVSGCSAGQKAARTSGTATKAGGTAPTAGSGSDQNGVTAPGGTDTQPGSNRGTGAAPPPGLPGGYLAPAPPGDGPYPYPPETITSENPQSTFGLDVDTASYTYAQSLIDAGRMPPADTVRPEEFINSFGEDYPAPAGNGFTVTLDGSHMPFTHLTTDVGDMRLLRVGLRTAPDEGGDRPDAALTFIIDVSGSMGDPGKLDLVKDALDTMVDSLRPTDSVAIVTFSRTAKVITSMVPASQRSTLHRDIAALHASGTTNLQAGLVTGYKVARAGFRPGATNRVVVLSDGLANTGSTSSSTLVAQVRAQADKQITLLGVGVGRDYGDTLMEQLADHADGFVVYVSSVAQARQEFVSRLPATDDLRALDAKAQVTFNPATVSRYRLIGYDDRALSNASFTNDHVDGGEVVAGYTVTALYAIRLVPGASGEVATAAVRWLDPATRQPLEIVSSVFTNTLDVPFQQASPRLRVCYAAAYFAEVLRGSQYGTEVRLTDLAGIASQAAEETGDPAAATLAETILRTTDLR